MGLTGWVYLAPENLEVEGKVREHLTRDPVTGEYDVELGWERKGLTDSLLAADEHVGNLFTVGETRLAVEEHCRDDAPILLQKVLYSGIHTGDFIPREKVSDLHQEVIQVADRLEELHQQGTELKMVSARYSLGAIKRLCEAAIAQNNAIAF